MENRNEEVIREMQSLLKDAKTGAEPLNFKRFQVGKKVFSPSQVIQNLGSFISENRKERIEQVLTNRTFNVATVVEGLVNTGNVSAVMRTAEGLGFQPFHVINNGGKFKKSERVSNGAEKWLNTWKWNDPKACTQFLKEQGYKVVVTALDKNAISLHDIDFTDPTALVLGNEAVGVTDEMLEEADQTCYIPMTGFTQSLNISVAAAICLHYAYKERLDVLGYHGDLTNEQEEYLRAFYYFRSANKGEQVLHHLK